MKRTVIISAMLLCLLVAAAGNAGAVPQVGASSVWSDGPTMVYGQGLSGNLEYCVLDSLPVWNEAQLLESFRRFMDGRAELSPVPSAATRWTKVSSSDDCALFLGLANIRQAAPALLYLRNAEGMSRPYLLNEPEVWGANPARARAGDMLTVWGVNLSLRYGLTDGKVHRVIKGYKAYNNHSGRYEGNFYNLLRLPEDLKPGRYRIYNWNGPGDGGWSREGLEIDVVARPKPPAVFNVRRYGARGDGVNDDTGAIRKAMQAASPLKGRVYLPAGTYAVTGTIDVPAGVTLFGEGRDSTTMEASRYAPFTSPFPEDALMKPPAGYPLDREKNFLYLTETGFEMATEEVRARMNREDPKRKLYIARTSYPVDWLPEADQQAVLLRLRDGSCVEKLTLDVSACSHRFGSVIIVADANGGRCDDVVIDRCRILSAAVGPVGSWPYGMDTNAIWMVSPASFYRIEHNEIQVNKGALTCMRVPHRDGSFSFNLIKPADPHVAAVAVHIAGERNLVQGNIYENTGRGKTAQSGGQVRPIWRNLFLHNIYRNLRKSDGEIELYETGEAGDWGETAAAGEDSLLVSGKAWQKDQWAEQRVMIVAGPGLGQVRWIKGNTENGLQLQKPWLVRPQKGSRYVILTAEALENLHLGNEAFDSHAWSGVYGAGVRNIWVNEVMERVGGGHYLWKVAGVRQMSLNLHLGARYHDRAWLMMMNNRYDKDFKSIAGEVPQIFGNEVRHSSFRQPSWIAAENSGDGGISRARSRLASPQLSSPRLPRLGEAMGIGIWDLYGGFERYGPDAVELDNLPVSTCWNLLADNLFHECPIGIRIGRRVENTVLWNNTYADCRVPLQDGGIGTKEFGAVVGKAFDGDR